MVKLLDAVVAVVAVGGARRPEELAGAAETDFLRVAREGQSVHAACFDVLFAQDSAFLEKPFL